MNVELVCNFLLWCTVLNYAVLVLWVVLFIAAHDWMHRLHGKWFRLSVERFDAIHYAAMAMYKIGIFLFNLAPFIALHIVS